MTAIRPLKHWTLAINHDNGQGSWHYVSQKEYGKRRYMIATEEIIIWCDDAGQWRCGVHAAMGLWQKMQGEQSAIIAAFRASGMQVARFRYRRDAVAALEALCAAVEIESV